MDLMELRNEIDEIDDAILELFIKRLNIAENIAKYKAANSLPVLSAAREQEILSRIRELAGDEKAEYAEKIFASILEISKEYQNRRIELNDRL